MKNALPELLLLACVTASGTTVTNVACFATGATAITGTSNCSTGTGAGSPSSTASSSVSVSGDLLSFTFSQSVRAVYAGSGLSGTSEADASGDVSLSLSTAGPVRQGYLRLLYEPIVWGLSPGDFSGTLSVAVNSGKTACGINPNQMCPFPFVPSDAAPAIPFTLGQSFSIDVNQSTRAFADFIEGSSLNIVNSRVILRILDTDGATPVAVSETPEPASWMLLGVSLSAVALACKKELGLCCLRMFC
jgi:hypothetical protein